MRSGQRVLSNIVASQIATHQPYGGVVPELASREHLRAIVPVVRQALAEAGQTYQSVDAIAVTQGPGLAGALLVGISYAKALAFALEKPLIAVNHLEGHIHAVLLEQAAKRKWRSLFSSARFSGAGAGGLGRPHASVSCPGAGKSLDLPEHRAHSRRRRRRGVRQSREAARAGLSRRTDHRPAGAARRSAGGQVPDFADQAPGPARSQAKRS